MTARVQFEPASDTGPELASLPSVPRRQHSAQPPGIALDDESFVAAAQAMGRLQCDRRARHIAGYVRHQPREAARWISFVARMPRLTISVTDSVQGQLIGERLRTRDHGVRTHTIAQCVLRVPSDLNAYLEGQQRRGLRNKLSKAQRFGIVTSVESAEAGLLADKRIYNERSQRGAEAEDTWPLPAHQLTWLVAYAPDETPIAVMSVIQDKQVALMKAFHGVPDSTLGSPARHALHQHLLGLLSAAGVEYLVGDSALLAPPGVRQFVHQLGYQSWHLRVRTPADR